MTELTDEEFVKIWENASSKKDVADACKSTPAVVNYRAQKLRHAGVKLKTFARGRPRRVVDVNALNGLIEKLNNV